jgi:hypothetical protein
LLALDVGTSSHHLSHFVAVRRAHGLDHPAKLSSGLRNLSAVQSNVVGSRGRIVGGQGNVVVREVDSKVVDGRSSVCCRLACYCKSSSRGLAC